MPNKKGVVKFEAGGTCYTPSIPMYARIALSYLLQRPEYKITRPPSVN